jgi:ATP-dependent DNA ligase
MRKRLQNVKSQGQGSRALGHELVAHKLTSQPVVVRPDRLAAVALRLPSPMLSRSGPIPTGDYAYELRWDGFRTIVARCDGFRVLSRQGWEMTALLPELGDLPAGWIFEGEIVAFERAWIKTKNKDYWRYGEELESLRWSIESACGREEFRLAAAV